MALSKRKMRERKQSDRAFVKPKSEDVKPKLPGVNKVTHDPRNGKEIKRGDLPVIPAGGLTLSHYHPIVAHLVDPEKRKKMIAIVESLKAHRQLENVYFGATKNAIGMNFVAELLETTE